MNRWLKASKKQLRLYRQLEKEEEIGMHFLGELVIEALFPRGRDLDLIERYAMRIGLRLAEMPLATVRIESVSVRKLKQ